MTEEAVDGPMSVPLTFRSLTARPVLLTLERPVVARIATIREWPLILIDLETEEGLLGRSYLEPYTPKLRTCRTKRDIEELLTDTLPVLGS